MAKKTVRRSASKTVAPQPLVSEGVKNVSVLLLILGVAMIVLVSMVMRAAAY